MSKRSELRRKQRNAEKEKKRVNTNAVKSPVNVLYGSQEQVRRDFGLSIPNLTAYLERMEQEIKKDFEIQYNEKLNKAEDYIAVGFLMTVIYALKMSRKSREHTKDLIQRMLDNLNVATEYVEHVGIRKAYEDAHADFDINIEFDSVELNEEFGFTKEG